MNIFDLTGKTALITGSSRGIGRDIALGFADAGANIIVHGSGMSERLSETAAEINSNGGKAIETAADLSEKRQITELIREAVNIFGCIDILVLNASIQSYMAIEEFNGKEFDWEYAVNLKSSFELIKAVLPHMKSRGWGRVLSIGSVNQWKQNPRLAVYSTTKSAQVNLIMNCAREYAKFGITFNNLAPGVIITDRNKETLSDENIRDKILKLIPASEFGKSEDCVGAALLLCSDAGSYITGADLPVTGGMHL